MSISRHARLHKLEKFVLFGASTSDHDMREERIFCQTQPQQKMLRGGGKRKREFVSAGNLTKASKIAKGVRR
jgi:hypothetical protein